MKKVAIVAATLLAFALATHALLGCGDDEVAAATPTPTDEAGIGEEAGAAPEYDGAAITAVIPWTDAARSFVPGSDLDAGTPISGCCEVAFAFPDPTGDETTARLKGDVPPLDGEGVPLTWSDGAWRASACVLLNTYVRYRAYLGEVPLVVDAGDGDGGGLVSSGGDAGPFAPDHRLEPDRETVSDGQGGTYSTRTLGTTCGDGG